MVAALAVRWQTSWANSRVSLASLGCVIRASVSTTRWSESKLRNGDCSSCADSPCRSVPSARHGSLRFCLDTYIPKPEQF